MNVSLRNLAIAALLSCGWSVSASAASIDFSDGVGNALPTFNKVIEENGVSTGVMAIFSNAHSELYPYNLFYVDGLGLGIGSGSLGYSWDVVFNQTVVLTGWQVGCCSSAQGAFSFPTATITGTGVNLNYTFPDTGTAYPPFPEFVLPSAITFLAGETYNFSVPNRCCDGSQTFGGGTFREWHFETLPAVPEPATLPLITLALAALAFRKGYNPLG